MCGIYGMVGADAEAVLPRMSTALVHRGPDGDGRAVRGAGGIGCRRLAIIDVAGGAQQLRNETADVIAVCNGEIYNHLALRAALESRGHRFRTRSDAEVLPHLYEERGLDFVDSLDGMFGLALWDARRGRLVLARDRLGEQPLYYATTSDGCSFASEPTALLASGAVSRTPDWDALAPSLRPGFVPPPATRSPRSPSAATSRAWTSASTRRWRPVRSARATGRSPSRPGSSSKASGALCRSSTSRSPTRRWCRPSSSPASRAPR